MLAHTLNIKPCAGKVKCSQVAFREQDTDAPIAPFVFVSVVLLRQHVTLFLQNQLTPVAKFNGT